jgi:hypothetical protein
VRQCDSRTVETRSVTTATVSVDSGTSGLVKAARAVNIAGAVLDGTQCVFHHDSLACLAAVLGAAGVVGDGLSSLALGGSVAGWLASAGFASIGLGAAGLDIGSGAAAILELQDGEGGRNVGRC